MILTIHPGSTIAPLDAQSEQKAQTSRNELYLITTPDQQKYVAKVTPVFQLGTYGFDKLFREERLISQLQHQGLYSGTGSLSDSGHHTLVLYKYLEGISLKQQLEKGPVSVETTLLVIEKVLETLEYLQTPSNHPQVDGVIIHRDIKPSNIIFNEATGAVTVIDLGSATLITTPERQERSTGTIHIEGSPDYMAPEIIAMSPCKGSDPYSLGVTALELLQGEFVKGLERAYISHTQYTIPDSFNVRLKSNSPSTNIPVVLRQFLQQMIEKDPFRRFDSAKEALRALAIVKSSLAGFQDTPANPIVQATLPLIAPSTQAYESQVVMPLRDSREDYQPLAPTSSDNDIFFKVKHFGPLFDGPSSEIDSSWNDTKDKVRQNLHQLYNLRGNSALSGSAIEAFLISPDNENFLSTSERKISLEDIVEQYEELFGVDAIARQLGYYRSVTPQYFDCFQYKVSENYRSLVSALTAINEEARRLKNGEQISKIYSYWFDGLSDPPVSSLERRLFTLLLGAVTKCIIFQFLDDCLESHSSITGRRLPPPSSQQSEQTIREQSAIKRLSEIAQGTFHSAHLRVHEGPGEAHELRVTIFIRPLTGPDQQLQVIRRFCSSDARNLVALHVEDTWHRSCANLEGAVRKICGYSIRLYDLEFVTSSASIPNQREILDSPCPKSEEPGAWFEAFKQEQSRCDELEYNAQMAKAFWLNTSFDFQDPLNGASLSISLAKLIGILEQCGIPREQVIDRPDSIRIEHNGLVQLFTTYYTAIFSASNTFWRARGLDSHEWKPLCRLAFVNGAFRILPNLDKARDSSSSTFKLLAKAPSILAYPFKEKSAQQAPLSSQATEAPHLATFHVPAPYWYLKHYFEGFRITRTYRFRGAEATGYITLHLGNDGRMRGVSDSGSLEIAAPAAVYTRSAAPEFCWRLIKDPQQTDLALE